MIGQAVSKKKTFEIVYGQQTTYDGQMPDHGYPKSSKAQVSQKYPNFSSENYHFNSIEKSSIFRKRVGVMGEKKRNARVNEMGTSGNESRRNLSGQSGMIPI